MLGPCLTREAKLTSTCFRTGSERLYGWSYTGIVGRASVGRLLEIALARMREEPAILRGDADFYEELAITKKAKAHALAEYYAGRGPRPGRHLPLRREPHSHAAAVRAVVRRELPMRGPWWLRPSRG
jgi:hypothetical protein